MSRFVRLESSRLGFIEVNADRICYAKSLAGGPADLYGKLELTFSGLGMPECLVVVSNSPINRSLLGMSVIEEHKELLSRSISINPPKSVNNVDDSVRKAIPENDTGSNIKPEKVVVNRDSGVVLKADEFSEEADISDELKRQMEEAKRAITSEIEERLKEEEQLDQLQEDKEPKEPGKVSSDSTGLETSPEDLLD